MKLSKIIIIRVLIFLFPFFLGNTVGDCSFLYAIFYVTLPPPPEPVDYNDIGSYHSGGFILAANNGKIYYANSWEFTPDSVYNVPGAPDLFDIYQGFWQNEINIISGANGTILRSTPENPQWTLIPSPVSHNLNKIVNCSESGSFQDIIYIVGDNGSIIKSTDNGLSWNIINFNYSVNLRDIDFLIDCEHIIVSGEQYSLYRSTDGGNNWTPISIGLNKLPESELSYERIYFYDDSLGFVAGPNGLIIKTSDGGWNWEIKFAQGFQQINDIYFISPDSGAAVGTNGIVRFTTNGGDTWFEDPDVTDYLDGRDVRKILALSRNYGFIVGQGGLLTFAAADSSYLDSAFVVTSVDENPKHLTEFVLYQNYPNPFNPTTKISFFIGHSSFVSLKVYDLLGKEAATLLNEEKLSGSYSVEFDASGLASGIYFYQLKAGSFSESKKLVFIR